MENFSGWISPSGEQIKCEGHAHLYIAMQITKSLNLSTEGTHADEVLLKHGWLRVSKLIYMDYGYVFWLPPVLSEPQKVYMETIYNYDPTAISSAGLKILRTYKIIEE